MRHYTRADIIAVADLAAHGAPPEEALVHAEEMGLLSKPDPAQCGALSHPIRTRILRVMHDRPGEPISPIMLMQSLDAPLGNISYHVRYLVKHGLLKSAGTVPRRGAVEHYYTLSAER